jgi:hypothetical protein
MRAWSWRWPTVGETALAKEVFGTRLCIKRLRLIQLGGMVRAAFVLDARTMVFHGGWPAPCDFAHAGMQSQGLLIHELTHVMQAQAGVFLPLAKLGALGRAAYRYEIKPGRPFSTYGLEQQAEIVRHAFLLGRGWRDASMPAAAVLQDYRAMGAPGVA